MSPAVITLIVVLILIAALGALYLARILSGVAFLVLGLVIALVGVLAGTKISQISAMKSQKYAPPPEPVTTASVTETVWRPLLPSVGTLTAVQGVMVTSQLDGNVTKISFEAGATVKQGDLLVQQDITTETAQLQAAKAAAALAHVNLERTKELLANNTISKAQFDADDATFKQAVAQAANVQSVIEKKTIRAPFAGRLGIRQINLGQTLKAGDAIVSLQSLNPIYADFSLPEQDVPLLAPGTLVRFTCDAIPGRTFRGKITAVNPDVDSATRNVRTEATFANADEALHPGMFVDVNVVLPERNKTLVIPATSVLFAPYGDSVFVVEDKPGGGQKVVRQQFVRLGERRGDFVAVTKGLKPGEVVVTTGAFKLRNGIAVVISNSLAPDAQIAPTPDDS